MSQWWGNYLFVDFLSPPKVCSLQPVTEASFLISWLCLFVSAGLILHPQQITAKYTALTNGLLEEISNILLLVLKDLNFLKKQSLLISFLYAALTCIQHWSSSPLLMWTPRYLYSSTISTSCARIDMGCVAVLFLLRSSLWSYSHS